MLEESIQLNKLFVDILRNGDTLAQEYVWDWFLKRAEDPIKDLRWKIEPYQPIRKNINIIIEEEDISVQITKLTTKLSLDLSTTDFVDLAREGNETVYLLTVKELKEKIQNVCSLTQLLKDREKYVKGIFRKKVR